MATLNRHSLREELDALEAQFEALCAEGKVNADSRALFQALLTLFKLLMAVFMEKTTPKGNANSSLPSSKTPDEDTATARPATRGKGPAHRPHPHHRARRAHRRRAPAPLESHTTERRTRIDIVFEKTLPHHPHPRRQRVPPIPPRRNGQRGTIARSDAHNLCERMQKHETAVLLFAKNPHVAFTNNRA